MSHFETPFVVSLSNHALGTLLEIAAACFAREKRGSTGSPRTVFSTERDPGLIRLTTNGI